MIPSLVSEGFRCIAPDLVGFGRSDKPLRQEDHTYERHVAWLQAHVFGALELEDITLVCQDWGGLIGLRLVAAHPERFARVVTANTGLPDGSAPLSDAFLAWQSFAASADDFPVGAIVNGGCTTALSEAVIAGYDAPFPDDRYKAAVRVFPSLVPTRPDGPSSKQVVAAWEALRAFDKPWLCAFSDGDPITRGGFKVFESEIPGAAGQPHITIQGGGHFLQEDRGLELAAVVARFAEQP
jgi:haloalkane dehalogenase